MKTGNIAAALLVATPLNLTPKSKGALSTAMLTLAAVEADFAAHMLYVTNQDKPGFIGRFGMALADAGVNIATFHLGRSAPGGDAICLVGLDGPMPEGVLDGVRKLPLVMQATQLAF